MAIPILMPSLSPTMTEGNLAKWCKNVGDEIKPGDIIAEVETDKATMEIEAIDEGVLDTIFYGDGDEGIAVNSLIAVLKDKNDTKKEIEEIIAKYGENKVSDTRNNKEDNKTNDYSNNKEVANSDEEKEDNLIIDDKLLEADDKNKDNEIIIDDFNINIEDKNAINIHTSNTQDTSNKRIMISPLARRMAEQNSIDLNKIVGSGPKGRIIKIDIDNYLNKNNNIRHIINKKNTVTKIPLMRKVIAERLSFSKSNVPHFYLSINCNVDKLLQARNDMNLNREKDNKISINDIIIKAMANALVKVPEANSSWGDNKITIFGSVDISVAVAVKDGLLTPVVKTAEMLSIGEISKIMKDFIQRANDGKLLPEEYTGGNFTISNLGMYDIDNFSAIINPPQSGILAVGSIKKLPVIINDEVVASNMFSCQLSGDHRIIDGAVGAKLLREFKTLIENPYQMLV